MVFYFSTNAHKEGEDAWLIYMGRDKYENEDLIKHGWPVDVWYALLAQRIQQVEQRFPGFNALSGLVQARCTCISDSTSNSLTVANQHRAGRAGFVKLSKEGMQVSCG